MAPVRFTAACAVLLTWPALGLHAYSAPLTRAARAPFEAALGGSSGAQLESDRREPRFDPLVADRLALLCAALDAGQLQMDEKVVRALLEQPAALADGLTSAFQWGSWVTPGASGDAATTWKLTPAREALLRALAARLPRELALAGAKRALQPGSDPKLRAAALVLLGEVAVASDVRTLVELAATPPGQRADERLGQYFERALTVTLRDESACRELDAAWKLVDKSLRLHALRALTQSARSAALVVLAARLDDERDLTLTVLSFLGALAARTSAEPDTRVGIAVRARLDSTQPGIRREAALALGRMEDAECVPRLIAMLEAEERSERDAAHWALKRISRLGLGADARPWRLWIASEELWWLQRSAICFTALSAAQPGRVVGALDEIARHRWRRSELAQEICKMALPERAEHVERQCIALGVLQSKTGLDFLSRHLDSTDARLQAAAREAWTLTTGEPPPLEALAWNRRQD